MGKKKNVIVKSLAPNIRFDTSRAGMQIEEKRRKAWIQYKKSSLPRISRMYQLFSYLQPLVYTAEFVNVWANCLTDRRSYTGYIFTRIDLSSRKQENRRLWLFPLLNIWLCRRLQRKRHTCDILATRRTRTGMCACVCFASLRRAPLLEHII